MINGQKVVVILPAYNAEKTLEMTYREIPLDIVDDVLLVDDASHDKTVEVAKSLGIKTVTHPENRGYGANQKTCYTEALKLGADIVIMVHPDYQYTPKLIPSMAYLIECGQFDAVLGSRILSGGALKGGMPLYKYIANRALTFMQNLLIGQKLSEYHTGYRAFKREILEKLPLADNSDDFIFDNQMLSQVLFFGYSIGEISCPAKYFPEASSINLRRASVYGVGVIIVSIKYFLQRVFGLKFRVFSEKGKKLIP